MVCCCKLHESTLNSERTGGVPPSLLKVLGDAMLVYGAAPLFLLSLFIVNALGLQFINTLWNDQFPVAILSALLTLTSSLYFLYAAVYVAYPRYLGLIVTRTYVSLRDSNGGAQPQPAGWLEYGWRSHFGLTILAYLMVTVVAVGVAVSEFNEIGNSAFDMLFDLTWVANQLLVLLTAAVEYMMTRVAVQRFTHDTERAQVDTAVMAPDEPRLGDHWKRLAFCRLLQLFAAGHCPVLTREPSHSRVPPEAAGAAARAP